MTYSLLKCELILPKGNIVEAPPFIQVSMQRRPTTTGLFGLLIGILFASLLTMAGVGLDSIIFGYVTLAEASTLTYIKIFSLPVLLNVLVGIILVTIKHKAIGRTVIVVGVIMSLIFPNSLVVVT